MTVVVTGTAGFIGSHLAERLLADGESVVGIDCFTPYYDRAAKEANLTPLLDHGAYRHVGDDLCDIDLTTPLAEADVVFHLAAQPGVRLSWDEFDTYTRHNLVASQRLLEAARHSGVRRVVFASSSSVYGNADHYPVTEDAPLRPYSPYGVTKAADEHLCAAYTENWGLPTVMLRYFTVFGPRQRPDMSIHRLIESALSGEPFPLFGAGDYEREFTFVADIVDATVRAGEADLPPATTMNLAGGEPIRMRDLIALVEGLAGTSITVDEQQPKAGDVRRNGGAIDRATSLLGWRPATGLKEGIEAQIEWHRQRQGATTTPNTA